MPEVELPQSINGLRKIVLVESNPAPGSTLPKTLQRDSGGVLGLPILAWPKAFVDVAEDSALTLAAEQIRAALSSLVEEYAWNEDAQTSLSSVVDMAASTNYVASLRTPMSLHRGGKWMGEAVGEVHEQGVYARLAIYDRDRHLKGGAQAAACIAFKEKYLTDHWGDYHDMRLLVDKVQWTGVTLKLLPKKRGSVLSRRSLSVTAPKKLDIGK